jgi:hypothetical protein
MKAGSQFEKLSAEIFMALRTNPQLESVEHNVQLLGIDGPRQIDVLMRGRVGPLEILTIIECKDTNSVITVQEVDALHSKMQDVGAQKAVLVTHRGFSGTAKKKAARLGISLCTAQEARHARWPLRESVPFIIDEMACVDWELLFSFTAIASAPSPQKICGIPIWEIIAAHWNEHEPVVSGDTGEHEIIPAFPQPPWILTREGVRQPIHSVKIKVWFKRSYYFGYFNDLASAKCLTFVENAKRHVLFDANELGNYRTTLARYAKRSDVPKVPGAINVPVKIVLPSKQRQ